MSSNKKRVNSNYIISVESRKGGVGKTTAALCIAKLLYQRGFEVLFLDTDITGTNITLALKSAFWEGITHIVKTPIPKKKEIPPSNLLALFEREFMAGRGVPVFGHKRRTGRTVLLWQFGMINIIGSQVYDEKEGKIICKPSILFDELHAFWFVKFLSEICSNFREVADKKNKRAAIIIDNSPGYVGIGPAIQEWLTDIGVDRSKFLFVSSLDEQDLRACLEGIDSLHSSYCEKWEVAKKLDRMKKEKQDQKRGGITDWEGVNMKFAIRLLEHKRDDNRENFDFYLGRGLKYQDENSQLGDSLKERIERYQGIIVNRVPWRFKKRWWTFKLENTTEKFEKTNELLFDKGHWGEVSPNLMVEYNEYIENQFINENSVQREREWRTYPESLDYIIYVARDRFKSHREERFDEEGDLRRFWKRLNDYQAIIDDLLLQLAGVPIYTLRNLVKEEWQPKGIGIDFSLWLGRALYREFLPFTKEWSRPKDIEQRIHEMEKMQRIVRVQADETFRYTKSNRDNIVWEQILFSGGSALALAVQNWGYIPFEKMAHEFGRLVGQMCAIEMKEWLQRKSRSEKSVAMFLAQEQLGEEEYSKKWFRRIPPIRHFFEDKREIGGFYEAFTKTQARILDLESDVDFLISMIAQTAHDEQSVQGLLPYIEGVAKRVIVEKKISHARGIEDCRKGFRIAESLEQFEEVLRRIITRWEIE